MMDDQIVETEELEQEVEEKYQLNIRKLHNRATVTSVAILVTLFTLFFTKYRDFDVIFKAIYNLKFEEYILTNNLGSILFTFGFVVSLVFTIFIWVFLYSKKDFNFSNNGKKIYESFDIISIIPIFIVIIVVLNTFILSPASVTRTSMEPNYYEGDNVFILHTSNYQRFDVVIVLAEEGVYVPETGGYTLNEYYIKRIIGLPGETVTLKDGDIYIDGVLLDDPTVLKTGAATYCTVGFNVDENAECTFVVPEGEYFLIGDNREASFDSRALGPFKEENLYGKVLFKLG
jgi:signal peptidase I